MDAVKPKRHRSPNKIKPTRATARIWKWFLKPFAEAYGYAEGQEERVEGYQAFFNTTERRVVYCKARHAFKMPGSLWGSPSQPQVRIEGTGRRYVKAGEPFVLRIDRNMPERVEIEFDEQVFVLSEAQYNAIAEHVSLEA